MVTTKYPRYASYAYHVRHFLTSFFTQVMSAPLPKHSKSGQSAMEVEPTLLAEPDAEDADSLVSSNEPDDLANEQTWPTEEEMAGGSHAMDGGPIPDAKKGTTPKAVKRVPKGTSSYQAAWIVDESDEDEEDEGAEGSDAGMVSAEEEEEEMVEIEEGDDTEMATDGRRSVAFAEHEDLDMEEEDRQLQTWRGRKREEEDDLQFPDEIDTPMDVPARARFQRFRGLRSFRTSPWDPFENLPRDYARIFQFEDFKRTERTVRRRTEEDPASVQVRSLLHSLRWPQ